MYSCSAENRWHQAYDCELGQEILFQIIPHMLPADNPQQSETSSHLGVNAALNCRRDLTGGSDESKETEDGYKALYQPGEPRHREQTVQAIRRQLWLACMGNGEGVKGAATASGVKDKIAQSWIEKLLAKARVCHEEKLKNTSTRDPRLNSRMTKEGRKELIEAISLDIANDLWKWLLEQPADPSANESDGSLQNMDDIRAGVHFNVLLAVRGKSRCTSVFRSLTIARYRSASGHTGRDLTHIPSRERQVRLALDKQVLEQTSG